MGTLAVVGLGYVGLPLAVQAAQKGYKVIGIDLNSNLVSMVNKRQSPYVNDDRFAKAIKSINEDSLTATTDIESIEFADVIVICVPTPTENNTPDLSLVLKASEDIANHIHPGQLIILESTVSPGITRDLVLPAIEGISGLKVGADINLARE